MPSPSSSSLTNEVPKPPSRELPPARPPYTPTLGGQAPHSHQFPRTRKMFDKGPDQVGVPLHFPKNAADLPSAEHAHSRFLMLCWSLHQLALLTAHNMLYTHCLFKPAVGLFLYAVCYESIHRVSE